MSINRNLKEGFIKMQRNGWEIKKIDGEQCLYRELNSSIDVEVSGLNNRKTKNYDVTVYVWKINPDPKIINTFTSLMNWDQVEKVLNDLEELYTNK